MTFCENLIELRLKRDLSQKKLAAELGIGLHTYQRYEYGQREPQLSTLVALADFYGISLDRLVGRDDPGPPSMDAGGQQP